MTAVKCTYSNYESTGYEEGSPEMYKKYFKVSKWSYWYFSG